jgi:nicotinamide riboside kinase
MKTNVIAVALLGTESTGKTQLAKAMAEALNGQGHSAVVVDEWLREWCEREGRTPRPDEQLAIAETQAMLVTEAINRLGADSPTSAAYVIADTTPLMTALYSDWLFQDTSLYPMALAQQRSFTHTLVTGLDLPWVADGLQRDGPHVREPIDALLRKKLAESGVPYKVIYGVGAERVHNAMLAIGAGPRDAAKTAASSWVWACDKCSDPECEHRLFSRLTAR